MAAPEIPNLRNLLVARGGARGRGRGRGGFSGRNELSEEEKDRIVQGTDCDASDSRISAVELGYLKDPYAIEFKNAESPRRYPIINRGTYVRSTALDLLVDEFLLTDEQQAKQIISLGAGSDTRFFRLASEGLKGPLLYHELDFPANTKRKTEVIKGSANLLKSVTSTLSSPDDLHIAQTGDRIQSPTYNLTPIDLRDLANPDAAPPLPNIDPTRPTLILSECCLCYLAPEQTTSILTTLTTALLHPTTPASLVLYEPIRPSDAFGRVMQSNLAARGIHLPTLRRYGSLAAQRARLRAAGFVAGQRAADVDFVFECWIPQAEKDRIARCEMLDELEEWRLLARHYCIAWGWRDAEGERGDVFARAWRERQEQEHDEGE